MNKRVWQDSPVSQWNERPEEMLEQEEMSRGRKVSCLFGFGRRGRDFRSFLFGAGLCTVQSFFLRQSLLPECLSLLPLSDSYHSFPIRRTGHTIHGSDVASHVVGALTTS